MKTIFVSSTFRDFQQERDVLHDKVLPFLNEKAKVYGESVSFCDLRWGVDTSGEENEDESSAKVLSVCMNEIDRSRPYMLVLLGERYGFMPGQEAIAREGHRKSIELSDLEISVTALEIEYGALQNQTTLDHTWFYFRELETDETLPTEYLPESQAHQEKLTALKNRIRRLAGDHIRFYKARWENGHVENLEDFARLVMADLKDQMTEEWKAYEGLDPYERDARSQWNYLNEKARSFSVFEKFSKETEEKIIHSTTACTALTGPAGSGKSTMFAKICQTMKNRGWQVIPFCGGSTSLATDAFIIEKSIIWQLENQLGQPHFEELEQKKCANETINENLDSSEENETISGFSTLQWRNRLNELCTQITKQTHLLLAVDALDQLQESEIRDMLEFLPSVLLKQLRIFVTCLSDYELPRNVNRISMPIMNEEEQRTVVKSALALLGKELSEPVTKALTTKSQSNTPLYLYLAVSRLSIMNARDFQNIRERGDGMDAITAQQLDMVAAMPEQLEHLGVSLIEAVGERICPEMVEAACRYLALSRHGLRLSDLKGLLTREEIPFLELEFAQLVNYMNEMFLLRSDGRYDFLHKSLRQGLISKMLETGRKLPDEHQKITDYLNTLPDDDAIRIQESTWESMVSNDEESFICWMTHIWKKRHEDPGIAAGHDIAAFCRKDQGVWLSDCILHLKKQKNQTQNDPITLMSQLSFLTVCVFLPFFGDKLSDFRIKCKLVRTTVECLEDTIKETPEHLLKNVLSDCYPVYGNLLTQSNLAEERKQSLLVLKRGYDLTKELQMEKKAGDDSYEIYEIRLANIAYYLARAYYEKETRDDLLEAIHQGEVALYHVDKVHEQVEGRIKTVNEFNAKMIIASACARLNEREYLEKGYLYTLEGIRIMSQEVQKEHTAENVKNLGKVYTVLNLILGLLVRLGNEERLPEALRSAQTAMELMTESDRMRSTPESRSAVASGWNNLAVIRSMYEDADSKAKALSYQQKSCEIYQAMAEELQTPESILRCANGYGLLGTEYQNQKKYSEAIDAYLIAIRKMEELVSGVPSEKYLHTLCELIWGAVEACLKIKDRKYLYQAYELSSRESEICGKLLNEFPGEESQKDWKDHLKHCRKLTTALASLPENEDKRKTYLCGCYLMKNSSDMNIRKQLLEEMFTLCRNKYLELSAQAQQQTDLQKQNQIWDEAAIWVRMEMEVFSDFSTDECDDFVNTLLSIAHRDIAGISLMHSEGDKSLTLKELHIALEVLEQIEVPTEMSCRLRYRICELGKYTAELISPETGLKNPEDLFFAQQWLLSMQAIVESWGKEDDWRDLNLLSYELGEFYEEQGDIQQTVEMLKIEASSGEQLLYIVSKDPERCDEVKNFILELRDTCYRTEKQLRKLGTPEALTEALAYSNRNKELEMGT